MLTVSIHADPARFYPFFWGHAQERGEGAGRGANLNLPLARGTGDDDYLRTLDTRLARRSSSFGTDALVVALGLDAHENDPFQGLAVTDAGLRPDRRGDRGARPADALRAGGRVSVRRPGRAT